MKQTTIKFTVLILLILCGVFYLSLLNCFSSVQADETGLFNPDVPELQVFIHRASDQTDLSTVEVEMQDGMDPNSAVEVIYRTEAGKTIKFKKRDFWGLLVKGLKNGKMQTIRYDGTAPDLESAYFTVLLTVRGPDALEKKYTVQVPVAEAIHYEANI